MELMLKDSLFVLLDGSWLIFFKLLLASVFWLFEAAHAQVNVSQQARDHEEVANKEVIHSRIESKQGYGQSSSVDFEKGAHLDISRRLVNPFFDLAVHLLR